MVSRIDLGPDGGPYVEIDEDAGDLVIRVPNNTVDFDSNDLLNAVLQNATMDGGSLDGVSLASALDADTQEIQNANLQNATLSDALDANNQDLNSVGTASVTALEAGSLSTESLSTELETGSDISDDRDFDTTYENTTGHDIVWYIRSDSLGSGEEGVINVNVGQSSNPKEGDNEMKNFRADGDTNIDSVSGCFYVPDGYYYTTDTFLDFGSDDVSRWRERGVNND